MTQRKRGAGGDEGNWEPEHAAGWDQAKDSAQASPTDRRLNLHRVRLWNQMRWLTWTCAALQWTPLILFTVIPPLQDFKGFATLCGIMAAASGLVLLPWVTANAVNVLYPIWFGVIWSAINRGFLTDFYGLYRFTLRFSLDFFTDNDWEFWTVRTAMAAAVAHVAIKAIRLYGRETADKNAICYWWRRPVDDVVQQGW